MDREVLKDYVRERVDFSQTDQKKGVPMPPVQKQPPEDAELIDLPDPKELDIDTSLNDAISNRESRRSFTNEPLELEELSFLLWATQGIREKLDSGHVYRVVPSAGCRHALETYIAAFDVKELEKAIYRYLPLEHQLVKVTEYEDMENKVTRAARGQKFVGNCAATFIWTTIPYRMEWRYGEASYKVIAMDAGHVCQNLYLACEAINCGTCAIAAYDQDLMDSLLEVDGEDEFTIYLAPVGKIS
ncbi:MAG: SagB/ThcOx family dehydrogenase [Candidatus Thermoplasmatota archaeon]|nr:SagB/ThcOx family dehydrogenase [Candidatus Thermoplasmatota archaeon]